VSRVGPPAVGLASVALFGAYLLGDALLIMGPRKGQVGCQRLIRVLETVTTSGLSYLVGIGGLCWFGILGGALSASTAGGPVLAAPTSVFIMGCCGLLVRDLFVERSVR
jgi:hypothetical protein